MPLHTPSTATTTTTFPPTAAPTTRPSRAAPTPRPSPRPPPQPAPPLLGRLPPHCCRLTLLRCILSPAPTETAAAVNRLPLRPRGGLAPLIPRVRLAAAPQLLHRRQGEGARQCRCAHGAWIRSTPRRAPHHLVPAQPRRHRKVPHAPTILRWFFHF
jgi:hypothetical protein